MRYLKNVCDVYQLACSVSFDFQFVFLNTEVSFGRLLSFPLIISRLKFVRPTALDEIFVISLSYFTLCARSTFRIKFSLQVNRVANAKNTRLFFENATVYFAVIVAILTDLAHRMNNSQVGFLLSLPRDTP